MIAVRAATLDDIPAMSRVLIRSITELCVADHRGDPAIVAGWTANKSEAGVRQMLANEAATLYVAERDGVVAAVGSILEPDIIGLNYVDPAYRFAGVSTALLRAMEDELRRRGFAEGRLESTETAHRFYRDAGWVDAGPDQQTRGMGGYLMRKRLA